MANACFITEKNNNNWFLYKEDNKNLFLIRNEKNINKNSAFKFINYEEKNKIENGTRPLIIKRILTFSKYYKQNKEKVKDLVKNN